jgi:hypothetical protein
MAEVAYALTRELLKPYREYGRWNRETFSVPILVGLQ